VAIGVVRADLDDGYLGWKRLKNSGVEEVLEP
jgi:hypothetical protein